MGGERSEARRQAAPRRVVIIGASGSGKTTLARAAAARLGAAHVELDALSWLADWQLRPQEEFAALVGEALEAPSWVVDGNYSRVRPIVWGRATDIVWLNYPLWIVMWRIVTRTFLRAVRQEELWQGNRERLVTGFNLFDPESIIRWSWKTWHRHQTQYPELFAREEFAQLRTCVLRHPDEAEAWLRALVAPEGEGGGQGVAQSARM